MEKEEIFEVVKECLAEAIGIDKDIVTMNSSLYDDIGAESLDLLDVFFRIEKKCKVRISMGEIQKILQGNLSEEEFFDGNGIVTPLGLEHLQKILPESNLAELASELDQTKLFSLFTVAHLVNIIAEKTKDPQ